jgi:hypothetical protein
MGSFIKGREKTGGRGKGVLNRTTLDTRKAILQALDQLGDELAVASKSKKQGIVSYLKAACREDLGRGIKLITAITPRIIDTHIETNTTIRYKSVAEIDEELARRGAPPLREIYKIDYQGSPVQGADGPEVTEAEAVEVKA